MQRVRIESICNICFQEESEETVAAYSFTAAVGRAERQLDWCEEHNKKCDSLETAFGWLAQYGAEPPSAADLRKVKHSTAIGARRHTCPYCERRFYRPDFLKTHIAQDHENVPGTLECPEPGCGRRFHTSQAIGSHRSAVHHNGELKYKCPHDGCDRAFPTAQTLGSHRSGAHGYRTNAKH